MRFVITVFLLFILWGYSSFVTADFGIPKWLTAFALLLLGVFMQLIYAPLVNSYFSA